MSVLCLTSFRSVYYLRFFSLYRLRFSLSSSPPLSSSSPSIFAHCFPLSYCSDIPADIIRPAPALPFISFAISSAIFSRISPDIKLLDVSKMIDSMACVSPYLFPFSRRDGYDMRRYHLLDFWPKRSYLCLTGRLSLAMLRGSAIPCLLFRDFYP